MYEPEECTECGEGEGESAMNEEREAAKRAAEEVGKAELALEAAQEMARLAHAAINDAMKEAVAAKGVEYWDTRYAQVNALRGHRDHMNLAQYDLQATRRRLGVIRASLLDIEWNSQ